MMNIKQKLIELAKEEELESLNITEKFENIVKKLIKNASNHKFTIHFLEMKKKVTSVEQTSEIGYQLVVPKNIGPEVYRQLFIDSLRSVGFENTDMEKTVQHLDFCDDYKLILTW